MAGNCGGELGGEVGSALWEALFAQAPVGLVIVDTNLRIQRVNTRGSLHRATVSSTSSTTVSANSGTATSASSRPLATEIIVSELVTNAIRHGTPPVRLRLIKDRFLTCEVPDASPAAPHLRHARTLDEGGRGLFVVAQLAQHWGTRCTGSGKTIWTEQALSRQPVRQPER